MPPVSLEQLRKLPAGLDRYRAITEYVVAGEAKIRDARKLADEDLRALAAEHGPAAAARMAGVSVSTIKRAVGRP